MAIPPAPGLVRPPAAASPAVRALGRGAAVLALASAAVHVALLDPGATASLAMTAMALVCLPCAWHLWRSPTPGVWGLTAAVDVGMLAVHGQTVSALSVGQPAAGQPAGGHVAHAMTGAGGWLVWAGLALVGAQLLTAATAGLLRPGRSRDGAETIPLRSR